MDISARVDYAVRTMLILAEEVAHIAARHATEQASRGELVNSARLSMVPAGSPALQQARAQVMEADFLGMQYLYKAGYDANAASTFLQKIASRETVTTATIVFSPIPPAKDRIAAMRNNIRLILPARTQSVVTTPEFDRIKALVKQ